MRSQLDFPEGTLPNLLANQVVPYLFLLATLSLAPIFLFLTHLLGLANGPPFLGLRLSLAHYLSLFIILSVVY